MEHISNTAARATQGAGSPTSESADSRSGLGPDAERALVAVWTEFANLWPTLWTKTHGDPGGEVYQAWCRTLAGLSAKQIARGLDAVRHSGRAYPPEAPEFRRLCRVTPGELGLPDADTALRRALARNWTPPAVWYAKRRMADMGWSGYDMHVADHERVMPDWRRVWQRILDEVDAGAAFPEPEAVGPPLPSQPAAGEQISPAEARRNVDAIRRRLRGDE